MCVQKDVKLALCSTVLMYFIYCLEQFKARMWEAGQWEDRDAATLCYGKQAA